MNKLWLVPCACALALTGCMHATKAHFVQHYTLDGATPAASVAASHADRGILQIAQIVVPEWLDGTAMYYRLDYERDGRLAAYANSDWIAPPATLLEPLLQRAIVAGGGWRAVIGPRNPATADASLQIRLDDFSQVFSQPGHGEAVIDATVTLIDNHDDSVAAQKHFRVEVTAPGANAAGGASALGKAARQFASRVQQWLQTSAAASGIQSR